ncbi:MAG: hypothetical protein AAF907_12985 [Planctomycetota bacterium]
MSASTVPIADGAAAASPAAPPVPSWETRIAGWAGAWQLVPALALVTLATRVVLAVRLEAVTRDAFFYQMLAQKLREGDLDAAFHQVELNLYIGLCAALGRLGELVGVSPITAAMVWGVIAAGLTVPPLFDWLKRQFGVGVAIGGVGTFAGCLRRIAHLLHRIPMFRQFSVFIHSVNLHAC